MFRKFLFLVLWGILLAKPWTVAIGVEDIDAGQVSDVDDGATPETPPIVMENDTPSQEPGNQQTQRQIVYDAYGRPYVWGGAPSSSGYPYNSGYFTPEIGVPYSYGYRNQGNSGWEGRR